MSVRLEILDARLRDKLRVYALLSPHIKGLGQHNSAEWCDVDGRPLLHARREDIHMIFGGDPDFKRRSVGYVGTSDGFQDLSDDFRMSWEFKKATDGNIALTAEIDLSRGKEFLLGVSFGHSPQSSSTKLLQSFATSFEEKRAHYVRQWKRTMPAPEVDLSPQTGDGGHMYRLSRLVLLAHEDKIYPGALVASMSIPWGETKGDVDLGGYHLVWPRDMVKSASALLATGQTGTPLRSLIWLASTQRADGCMPQNSWINGDAYWQGKQLDEVAAPVLLAWKLRQSNALGLFDPWPMISRAARYLILNGPVTGQERWEESSGYSPSTLAAIIAALVCAAEFARFSERTASVQRKPSSSDRLASFILDYADWLSAHLEEWLVTTCGELLPGKPRHYIRINPADPAQPGMIPNPNTAQLQISNGGGQYPASNIVSTDFLELVRLGIRDPNDPIIRDSIEVIDRVLKHDLPQGPCWQRYNHDGYGQKDDGSAYDGTGTGRCWPLLTGERGHYELAAGRDPMPYIEALEKFANEGGMLPEQVWNAEDLPEARMKRGSPTGSAMPLCWAHAEYLSLVRSHKDGAIFDCPAPVRKRYVEQKAESTIEIWTFAHQPARIRKGKTLRVITSSPAIVHWSVDAWKTVTDSETDDSGLGCWYADLPAPALTPGNKIVFTLRWGDRWEGRDFSIEIVGGND